MTSQRRIGTLAILATLAISGCGHSPTAPVPPPPSSLVSGGEESAIQRVSPEETPAPDPIPVQGSATIHGKTGGTLAVGDFTLVIPPGAFRGNATITLRQSNPQLKRVEIEVEPASKNDFLASATLTADLSGWTRAEVRRASLWCVDPATGTFNPVSNATVDLEQRQVRASFARLSTSEVKPSWPRTAADAFG